MSELYSDESELAVIGAVMLDNGAIHRVGWLKAEWFSARNHSAWQAVLNLSGAKTGIDPVTLAQELERTSQLENFGGRIAIQSVLEQAVSAVDIEYHARKVKHLAGKRVAIRLVRQVESELKDEADADPLGTLNSAIEKWSAAFGAGEPKAETAKELVAREIQSLVKVRESGHLGLATGISEIIDSMNVLIPGEITCFTAWKAGGGKSSFIGQIVRNVAASTGSVLLCSAELSSWTIFLREIAARTGVKITNIIRGESILFERGIEEFANSRIMVDSFSMPTVAHIRNQAYYVRRLTSSLSLVVIDMLQHIGSEGRNEWEMVGNTMKALKRLAKELDIPIVIVSSVNRSENFDGLPTNKNLYGSSWIDSLCATTLCLVGGQIYYQARRNRYAREPENGRGKPSLPDWGTFWQLEGWQKPPEDCVVLMAHGFKTRHGAPKDIPLAVDFPTFTFRPIDEYVKGMPPPSHFDTGSEHE